MKTNARKLILGASIVGTMALTSGCSSLGMCGGSKSASSGKCGGNANSEKAAGKCGADSKDASKCGSH